MTKKITPTERIPFREYSHAFKLKVVQEIENGLISRNFFPAQWDPKLGIHVT